MNSESTFCENCREDVSFSAKTEVTIHELRGENVEFEETVATCNQCGREVWVAELHDKNLMSLHDAYRAKNGFPTVELIESIPVRYAIDKRQLSLLLGWGELTFTRYCDGDLPSKQYAAILNRLYSDPEYFLSVLEAKKGILNPAAYRKSKTAALKILNRGA